MSVTRSLLVLTALAALAGGCEKKVELTVYNHTESARTLQLTTPDDMMTLGAISAGGRLSSTMKVKKDDLPAQCRLSAGPGAEQSFTVTDDSPGKWWFHITKDGALVGPYGKNDVHQESDQTMDVTLPAGSKMIVK